MSIPPPKEPKPLTPKDWQDALNRLHEKRLAEERKNRRQNQTQIVQKPDTRFTSEEQDKLKELKEKVNSNDHIMIINVRDDRDGLILVERKEIVGGSKQIEIPKNANGMEIEGETTSTIVEHDIKRMEIEPEPESGEDQQEKEFPNLTADEIGVILKDVEQKQMEEEEEEVKEEEEEEQIEEQPKVITLKSIEDDYKAKEEAEREAAYGLDVAVLLDNIITSDKKAETVENRTDTWDKINSERMKIRFLFADKYELCVTVWNMVSLKWKPEEKVVNGKKRKEWVVQKIIHKTDYEIYIVNPEGKAISLKRDQEWFRARKERVEREIENSIRSFKRDPEYSYTSPERLVGFDQVINIVDVTSPETASAKLTIYNSEFVNTLKDPEAFVTGRKERSKQYEKTKRSNELMHYMMLVGPEKIAKEHQEYEKLKESFDTIFERLNSGTMLDDYENPVDLRNFFLSIFGEEKTRPWIPKILRYFQLHEIFGQILKKDLELKIPDVQEEEEEQEQVWKEQFQVWRKQLRDWFENGEKKVYEAEHKFRDWDRDASGKVSKKKNPPFEVMVYTQPVKRGMKNDKRKVIINFQFEDVEQYQKIEEVFKHKLENIVLKVTEQKPKDIKYLEQYFGDEKKKREERKEKERKEKEQKEKEKEEKE